MAKNAILRIGLLFVRVVQAVEKIRQETQPVARQRSMNRLVRQNVEAQHPQEVRTAQRKDLLDLTTVNLTKNIPIPSQPIPSIH